MTVEGYYRRALSLPLLVPVLASPLALFNPLPPSLSLVMTFLFGSVLIGGAPYVLFAIGFLVWTRGAAGAPLRRAILVSPLVYTGVLVVCLALFLGIDGTLPSSAASMGTFAGVALLMGYGYVMLAELGRLILRPGTLAVPAV